MVVVAAWWLDFARACEEFARTSTTANSGVTRGGDTTHSAGATPAVEGAGAISKLLLFQAQGLAAVEQEAEAQSHVVHSAFDAIVDVHPAIGEDVAEGAPQRQPK